MTGSGQTDRPAHSVAEMLRRAVDEQNRLRSAAAMQNLDVEVWARQWRLARSRELRALEALAASDEFAELGAQAEALVRGEVQFR